MKKFRYLILAFLLITTIYIWVGLFEQQATDGWLEINFFDVGQGDSIFIETPSGQQILIDGGPDAGVLEKLGQEMSFFDRDIDLVISTHPDADHLTGLLEVLKYFDVGLVLTNGLKKDTAVYKEWQRLIEEKEIPLKKARAGQRINLGQGIYMKILWPKDIRNKLVEKTNDYSIVVQLVYDQAEFLFTADIEKSAELSLAGQGIDLKSDVLKIAHHGSKGSTNPLFLEKINPQVAIISVGQNSYGHPHQDVLERLDGIKVYRTDQAGNIEILSNGKKLRIQTEK